MLRQIVLSAMCGLTSVAMSGCCLFHCCHDPCGYTGCGPGAYGGYEGSYGACVTPLGCPECATGMYGTCVDPVQQARAVRLQRMHRTRGVQQCRGRQSQPYCGPGGYGCADAYCGDHGDYGFDSGCCNDCHQFCDCNSAGLSGGLPGHQGAAYDGGFGSGWMPAAGNCQCGDSMSAEFMGGGWVEGPWVEHSPQASPQSAPQSEPNPMPADQAVPNPMPLSHEQYFPPRGNPTPVQYLSPESELESSSGGSAIQPVLWVPGGL